MDARPASDNNAQQTSAETSQLLSRPTSQAGTNVNKAPPQGKQTTSAVTAAPVASTSQLLPPDVTPAVVRKPFVPKSFD